MNDVNEKSSDFYMNMEGRNNNATFDLIVDPNKDVSNPSSCHGLRRTREARRSKKSLQQRNEKMKKRHNTHSISLKWTFDQSKK